MPTTPNWQYDELKQTGVDYGDPEIVSEYDGNHQRFRDYEEESARVLESLSLGEEHTVLDIGCGTGAFVLNAARTCKKVYAIDVSDEMLECTRKKADSRGLTNIECHRGGFLTYEHTAPPVDAVISVAALHHLPDFWKLVGLHRVAGILKAGGRMHLFDVVFDFDVADHRRSLDDWVIEISRGVGPDFAKEAEIHIRDEYSTCDWIMEGILERAGFRIDDKACPSAFGTVYTCTKEGD